MGTFYSGGNFRTNNTSGAAGAAIFGANDNDKQRIVQGTEELKKELLEKWNKENKNAQIFPAAFSRVHPDVIGFLLEFARVTDYDEIARQTNLNQQQRNALPQIVWQIAVTKNWNELARMLAERIAVAPAMNGAILQMLEQKIIGKVRALGDKPFAARVVAESEEKEVRLPLREALEKYSRLAEQTVTASMLKMRYASEPAKPSIRNWIIDYHDNMGSGKHEVMDRGNYLFHSENGKRLSASERQKLTIILKSLDDGLPVEIDSEKQAIVFNMPSVQQTANNKQQTTNNKQQTTMAQEIPMSQQAAPMQQTVAPRPIPQAVNPFVARTYSDAQPANTNSQFAESTFPAEKPSIKEDELSMHVQEKLKNFAPKQNEQDRNIFPANVASALEAEHVEEGLQKISNYFGERSIAPGASRLAKSVLPDGYTKEDRDYGFNSPSSNLHAVPVAAAEPLTVKNDSLPKKEDVSALFDKGIGVGTDKYFADFSNKIEGSESESGEPFVNVPTEENVRFASPQKFSTEQKEEKKLSQQQAAPPIEQLTAQKTQDIPASNPQATNAPIVEQPLGKQEPTRARQPLPRILRPTRSPYKITPMEDKYEGSDESIFKDATPKVSGNVVDLS